jgi:hypothetical protein
MKAGEVILVDTNIIIEATRTSCWSALNGHYRVETVEKCVEEARSGDAYRPGYVKIEEAALRERLTVHSVSEAEIAAIMLRQPSAALLDPGELHLWAHAMHRQDAWMATTADAAAIRVAVELGWCDRLVSLESMALGCGAKGAVKQLNKHFHTEMLSQWRTAALLKKGLS